MGALIQKALNALAGGNKEQRILLLGLDGAGKTTIVYKLKLGEYLQTVPTIGFNVEKIQYKKLQMTLWDIGGQTRIRALWHHYLEGTHALIYVLDTSDEERFNEAKESLHSLVEQECLQNVPILIYANKSDLTQFTTAELATKLDLHKLRRDWFIQKCCALNGDGLYEGLDWMDKQLQNK